MVAGIAGFSGGYCSILADGGLFSFILNRGAFPFILNSVEG